MITRVVGDRVDILNNNVFGTLYNFAVLPGASWLAPALHCPTPTLVLVTVDSIGSQRVGNRSLRWLRVHLSSATGAPIRDNWYGRIYEQVGSAGNYMLPGAASMCNTFEPVGLGPLQTYSANAQPPLRYSYAASALLLNRTAGRAAASLAVFPNPSEGRLTVSLPEGTSAAAQLRLMDLAGRCVWQGAVPTDRQIDVSSLKAGIYALRLERAGWPNLVQRVVLR